MAPDKTFTSQASGIMAGARTIERSPRWTRTGIYSRVVNGLFFAIAASAFLLLTFFSGVSGEPSAPASRPELATASHSGGSLIIAPEALTATAYPGAKALYTHTVQNTGLPTEVLTVSLSTAVSRINYVATITPVAVILSGGQSTIVTLTVSVPLAAPEDEENVTTVTAEACPNGCISATALDTTVVAHHKIYLPVIVGPAAWTEISSSSWPASTTALSLDLCHVSSTTFMFAGTTTTLYAATHNGSTWTPWSPVGALPANTNMTGIVFNAACTDVFVSTYTNGVWQGTRNGSNWAWSQLTGGTAVNGLRSIVLAQGVLFAAGDMGIHYWAGGWQSTGVSAATPIMHLSAADPQANLGPLYAVQWVNPKAFMLPQPAVDPTGWIQLNGIVDPPESTMRAVFGDADQVRVLGTSSGHYEHDQDVSNQWVSVRPVSLRAFARHMASGRWFAGYDDFGGISFSIGDGNYVAMNRGFAPIPEQVRALIVQSGNLYAATSEGVFVYWLSP